MVQANNNLDVKISLDMTAYNRSPVVKRVLASNYATLMTQTTTLAKKHGVESSALVLKYYDGDSWVIVEDDQDLELAFAIATSNDSKLMFTCKAPAASAPVPENVQMIDTGASSIGSKKQKKDKGPNRKALKNLINNELEKQSQAVFKQLLNSEDLPMTEDQTSEDKSVVHEGVACDGCGVSPIRGIRYKCSVRKNYDLCSICEERLTHEHAFLKIREAGGAPEVMITMLNEEEEEKPQQEESKANPNDPANFIQQMMGQFMNGPGHHGGRGGRGGRGRGRGGPCGMGRGGFGGPAMAEQMFGKFNEWKQWANDNPEDAKKKMQHCKDQWKDFGGKKDWCKKDWKVSRAIVQRKPEEVIKIMPGMTEIVELDILNDTHWPWKPNCNITLAEEQPSVILPIDVFSIPVEQDMKGKTTGTFQVPLTMLPHVVADDTVYEIHVTFRGPMGCPFGTPIVLKVQCVLNNDIVKSAPTDVDIYKLAFKLHEQL